MASRLNRGKRRVLLHLCIIPMIIIIIAPIPAKGYGSISLSIYVEDVQGAPLNNVTVIAWPSNIVMVITRPNLPLWFPLRFRGKTNQLGECVIQLPLNQTGYLYNILAYYPGNYSYVPALKRILIYEGRALKVTLRLVPGALINISGERFLLIEEPGRALVSFKVHVYDNIAEEAVTDYGESPNALGLFNVPRNFVIVPADVRVKVEVKARAYDITFPSTLGTLFERKLIIDNGSFIKLRQGSILNIDLAEPSLTGNINLLRNLVHQAKVLIADSRRAGFYLEAEDKEVREVEGLIEYGESYLAIGKFDECYANLREAYIRIQWIIERIKSLQREASASTPILTLLYSFMAIASASFLFDKARRKVSASLTLYMWAFIFLYILHPGFQLTPINSILPSAILFIGAPLLTALMGPRLINAIFKERPSKDIVLRSAIAAAISMEKRFLKRRKTFTALNILTVAAMVAAFVSLVYITPIYGLQIRSLQPPKPEVEGILVKSADMPIRDFIDRLKGRVPIRDFINWLKGRAEISLDFINWLKGRAEVSVVAPMVKSLPRPYMGRGITNITEPSRWRSLPVYGIIGVGEAEAMVTRLNDTVVLGRYLREGESDAVLISFRMAEMLEIRMVPWPVILFNEVFNVVGLLDDSKLEALKDIDGSSLLPEKMLHEIDPRPIPCKTYEVVIFYWETALSLRAAAPYISRVAALAKRADDLPPLSRLIVLNWGYIAYVSLRKHLYMSYLGFGIRFIGESYLMPLAILTLLMASLMAQLAYGRRQEVNTLSLLGLNPSHILGVFMTDAMIIGFIGSSIGYLLGLGFYKVMGIFLKPDVSMNVSYSWAIIGLLLSIATAILSTVLASFKSSVLMVPSRARRLWLSRALRPKFKEGSWSLYLPIKVPSDDVNSFMNTVISVLKEYGPGADIKVEDVERVKDSILRFTYINNMEFKGVTMNEIAIEGPYLGKCKVKFICQPSEVPRFNAAALTSTLRLARRVMMEYSMLTPNKRLKGHELPLLGEMFLEAHP